MQGLHHVVYILHGPDSDGIATLEKSWKSLIRSKPQLRVSREDLRDGYTETPPLSDEVKTFIDAMLKPHAEPQAPAEADPPEQKWS